MTSHEVSSNNTKPMHLQEEHNNVITPAVPFFLEQELFACTLVRQLLFSYFKSLPHNIYQRLDII